MKKHILMVLITMVLACLLGCGKKPVEEPPMAAPGGEEIQDECAIAVKITINPELELLLDAQEKIIAVNCLNQDAEDLYQEMDLIGKTYEEGFEEVLKKAIEKDLVKNGSQIHVMMNGRKAEITFDDLDRMAGKSQAVIDQVSADSGLALEMPIECAVLAVDAEPDQGNNGSDGPKEEVETDAAGNVIKKTVTDGGYIQIYEYTSEGHPVSHIEHFPDGTMRVNFSRVYHSTNPLTYTETNEWGDTYDITCDADGTAVMKSWQTPDGTRFEEWLDGETVTRRRTSQADGNIFDQEYENNVMVKEETLGPNGEKEVLTFHSNGEMATLTVTLPDGSVHEETRDENGVVLSNIEKLANGTIVENTCDSDGRVLVAKETRPDGVVETRTYTYYPNGQPKTSEMKGSDGSYNMRTYYENGNVKTEDSTDSNGNHSTMVFSQDGLTREETDSMGVKTITTYHASNYAIASKKAYHPTGAVNEHYYNEAGVEYRTYWKEANGRYGEAVYNADDSGSQTTWDADGTRIGVLYFDPTGRVTHGIDSAGNTYVPTGNQYAGKNQPGNIGKG